MTDEPPVTMPQTKESTEKYWTCRGDLWIRSMPARTIDEFASGDAAQLMVMREGNGSITVYDSVTGDRHSERTFESAKQIGDDIALSILSTRDEDMVAQSGLDASEWKFCWQDRFLWFGSLQDTELRIERHGARQWVAMNGRRSLGIAPNPSAAAAIFERSIGPRAPGAFK